jgi:predicted regulator of Ras-like GTPase activity (Roadblock/LC7/MglB family)
MALQYCAGDELMANFDNMITLGKLEGVQEATLCMLDGSVVASSSKRPELDAAAVSLHSALQALQVALPALAAPLTVTLDAEEGTVHMAQSDDAVLIASTGADANLGAVRLAIREALASSRR